MQISDPATWQWPSFFGIPIFPNNAFRNNADNDLETNIFSNRTIQETTQENSQYWNILIGGGIMALGIYFWDDDACFPLIGLD